MSSGKLHTKAEAFAAEYDRIRHEGEGYVEHLKSKVGTIGFMLVLSVCYSPGCQGTRVPERQVALVFVIAPRMVD